MIENSKLIESIEQTRYVSLTDSRQLYGSAEPLPLIKIASPHCDAVIAIQGAQLLEFCPKDGQPLLWLSPKALFSPGKAIRGGIPVCAPWFGVHTADATKPKHGFVRNHPWQVTHISEHEDDTVELSFQYRSTPADLTLFPHPFQLTLKLTLNECLKMSLAVQNLGDSIMPFSWALHSYFPIENLPEVRVKGLDNNDYLDAVEHFSRKLQQGDVAFNGEVDRVYESVGEQQIIAGLPTINITGTECPTAIIWNPGAALAGEMADIGIEHYAEYICVERGAAFNNSWQIAPGHTTAATLTITDITAKV